MAGATAQTRPALPRAWKQASMTGRVRLASTRLAIEAGQGYGPPGVRLAKPVLRRPARDNDLRQPAAQSGQELLQQLRVGSRQVRRDGRPRDPPCRLEVVPDDPQRHALARPAQL